jgi:hypothetical protein
MALRRTSQMSGTRSGWARPAGRRGLRLTRAIVAVPDARLRPARRFDKTVGRIATFDNSWNPPDPPSITLFASRAAPNLFGARQPSWRNYGARVGDHDVQGEPEKAPVLASRFVFRCSRLTGELCEFVRQQVHIPKTETR